jgi:hypothetical protein
LQESETQADSVPDTPTITPTSVGDPNNPNNPDDDLIIEENKQDNASCNIPSSGEVPILKWPKAVACWWEKTMEKPLEFSLTVAVEWELLEDIA